MKELRKNLRTIRAKLGKARHNTYKLVVMNLRATAELRLRAVLLRFGRRRVRRRRSQIIH